MEVTMDAMGRVLVPKALRRATGLLPGSKVDVSAYGAGVQIVPGSRTGRIMREEGRLVVTGQTVLTDDMMFALIDSGRA
ncbi:MAG: AbrB/MazE/SpoVT family DNA-binding domain-containing protein [Propionibacteriaceae bacterium]|jgi:AbrB family looped-hinge helix DNA binding protein|nr:AbrB/MazE/SpoVT family DNA-binding domain-containing protein [Propionibacteriaceae bacterium]